MPTNKIIVNPDLKTITYDVMTAGVAEFELTDVTVGINTPEGPNVLPFIAIHLLGDAETDAHIGDSLADEVVDDQVYAGVGCEYTQQVQIKLWCSKAVERDRLGPMVKAIVKGVGVGNSVHPGLFLTTDGLEVPKLGGGYDEDIDVTSDQYPSMTIFMRTYVLTAKTTLTIQEPVGDTLDMIRVMGEGFEDEPEATQTVLTAHFAGG